MELASADASGCFDKLSLPERQYLRPGQPAQSNPVRHTNHEDDVERVVGEHGAPDTAVDDRQQKDSEEKPGKCGHHFHNAHDQEVRFAPAQTGSGSQRYSDQTGHNHRQEADGQRRADAVDRAAEVIAANRVGTKGILPAGKLIDCHEIGGRVMRRSDPGGKHGDEEQEKNDHEPEHTQFLPFKPIDGQTEVRPVLAAATELNLSGVDRYGGRSQAHGRYSLRPG